ncbi:hypothetical protein Bca52824_072926 [Brassica carinata]|uniref:Uncharacterized protein n=1 Tax=Brassica carinata TaxID=52824 RepID=A0A8X7U4Q9_BRACI|nr:hypothetical protein Bca52824_072926 [Brassica carinata]
MAGDTNNMSGRNPRDCSSQKRMRSSNDCSTQSNKRSSVFRQSGENTNTPQTNEKRSVLLPLKRVFSTVLVDVTNTVHSTPTELQSGILTTFDLLKDKQNHQEVCNLANSTRPSNKQTQPNLNNSGLTWQSYEGHSSRNDSSTSNKRRCADILPTNLFKAFSISKSTEKHTATTSSPRGQQGFLDETNIDADSENLCPFEDQGFQIYDISSEEEETNYEDHSDYETTTLPQEEISVQTVQDDERAQPTIAFKYHTDNSKLHTALRKALTDGNLKSSRSRSLGVFIKFKEQGFGWASRLVHYMLGFKIWTLRRSMRCGLVGPEPLRFSLLEFENLTGLNREYIEDLETPKCGVTRDGFFTGIFGSSSEAGPTLDRIIATEEIAGIGRGKIMAARVPLHLHWIH